MEVQRCDSKGDPSSKQPKQAGVVCSAEEPSLRSLMSIGRVALGSLPFAFDEHQRLVVLDADLHPAPSPRRKSKPRQSSARLAPRSLGVPVALDVGDEPCLPPSWPTLRQPLSKAPTAERPCGCVPDASCDTCRRQKGQQAYHATAKALRPHSKQPPCKHQAQSSSIHM